MYSIYDIFLGAFMASVMTSLVGWFSRRQLQRTIDRQQDTINRLINREPVTYQEVGTKPPKPNREVYAAWGNQMVNIDEDSVD